jgi:hypothetical protein
MIGGVLSGVASPTAVFAANAVCFTLSAAMVWSVRGTFADPARTDADEHPGIRAGFRFVMADPVLRLILLAWVVLLFLLGPILVAELPLARSFGVGSVGYGFIAACWGGGAIAGSFVGRRLAVWNERATMVVGCAFVGAGFAIVAAAPVFGFALAGMAAAGIVEGATAASEAAAMGAFALSFPTAGFMLHLIGVRGVYVLAAVGCAVATLILIPAMRQLGEGEPAAGSTEIGEMLVRS